MSLPRSVTGPLMVMMLVASLVGCTANGPPEASPAGKRPNIVFVMVDDMDTSLLRFMPHVRQMQRHGVSFTNYTVTDSLCCPSRASMLTGKYPHNTGVITNQPPDGGSAVFHNRGEQASTVGTQLQHAGYRTALMGKYLNGYYPHDKRGSTRPYVPPGWTRWVVGGDSYYGYNYTLNENGRITRHGERPRAYLTDVLARRGDDFIRRNAEAGRPFFLQVAPYVPHVPATPAPRHEHAFPGLRAPRDPAFNEADISDKPAWLRDQPRLPTAQQASIDRSYRKRAQSLQAVDDMLGRFRDTLRATGQAPNTHIVFTSDNGFHLGQHRLAPGKRTAFETDTTVPLVVTGPGVPAGRTVPQPVENIDLRPTFAELAGAPPAPGIDGHSFAAPLTGKPATGWKSAALVEHHGPNTDPDDPDKQPRGSGNPPSYAALRTPAITYVEYATGGRSYYDRRRDPHQLTNTYATLPARQRAKLHATLRQLSHCHGADCWTDAGGQP
ncbi:MAG: sulfatase-like hydrolase/transferase [Pseudonocardiaceae bacterium]|nr:sulfatase-like hydrolase/transferase [Pseudonocardiaceae bacterium]